MSTTQSEDARVCSSGAHIGLAVVALVLGLIDIHVPQWAASLITWGTFITITYGVAVYKRRWHGWLAFWGLVALAVTAGILQIASVTPDGGGAAFIPIAVVGIYTVWYALIRMARRRPYAQVAQAVTRIEHHHFVHHAGAAIPQTLTATAGQPAPSAPKTISGKVVQAIAAPHRKLAAMSAAGAEREKAR